MATYIYETIPQTRDEDPIVFEVQQSMKDAPLTHHPKTGEPVRRLITGGFGFMGVSRKDEPAGPQCVAGEGARHACGPGCACGL